MTVIVLIFFIFPHVICDISSASPGYISIYSPSSGVTYYDSDTIHIQWTSSGVGNYVKIELYKSGYLESIIASNTTNSNNYNNNFYWQVPNGQTTSSYYKIRITSLSNSLDYQETGYFSIKKKSITVTSPSTGQILYHGDNHYIRWTAENVGNNFKIELYENNVYYKTIISSVYSSSTYKSYSWTVPSDLLTDKSYTIKIISTSYSDTYDFSSSFTIGERYIQITSPSGGGTLFRGETYVISWDSKNAGNYVSIKYKQQYLYNYNLIDNSETNDGKYEWTIPSNLDVGKSYQIKITSNYYSNIYDVSDIFYLDERYININSPKFDNKWLPNETHYIKWDSKNAGSKVNIWLLKNDVYYATIATNVNNSGNYSWIFANKFDSSSDYKIQIMSNDYNSVYSESQRFTIGGQSITIISPKDGDIWYKGQSCEIKWTSENAGGYVNINLYKNGKLYYSIESNTKNDGSFTWEKIPKDIDSENSYQIKIESVEFSDISGISTGNIAIDETFFQKITGPVIIIMIIAGACIGLFIFFKKFKTKIFKTKEEKQTVMQQKIPNINYSNLNQDEYENIWEER